MREEFSNRNSGRDRSRRLERGTSRRRHRRSVHAKLVDRSSRQTFARNRRLRQRTSRPTRQLICCRQTRSSQSLPIISEESYATGFVSIYICAGGLTAGICYGNGQVTPVS